MSSWYDGSVSAFSAEIARVRSRLSAADTGVLSRDTKARAEAGEVNAFSYVWTAAALEKAVSRALAAFLGVLNARAVPINSLKSGYLGLLMDAPIESLRALKDYEKVWGRRCELFAASTSLNPASFSTDLLPLDGRTIRSYHFETLWRVLHLPGRPLLTPFHHLALTDLADGRNAVAHGDEEPVTFGRRKRATDIIQLTRRVEDQLLNLVSEADTLLSSSGYHK